MVWRKILKYKACYINIQSNTNIGNFENWIKIKTRPNWNKKITNRVNSNSIISSQNVLWQFSVLYIPNVFFLAQK